MKTLALVLATLALALPSAAQTRRAPAPAATSAPSAASTTAPAPPAATATAAAPGTPPAVTAPASAPAAPPRVCTDLFLNANPGEVTLSALELEAICDPDNEGALLGEVTAACFSTNAEGARSFMAARKRVCQRFPQIAGTADLDLVARAYRASSPRLPKPPSVREARASPAAAQGNRIEEQGLSATMVAQGVGDFLAARAEKEVGAFATVELFSRLCASDTKAVLPDTCNLLEEQDNGAEPLGLGVLRRTITGDLERLPDYLLRLALERIRKHLPANAPDALESVRQGSALAALERTAGGPTSDAASSGPAAVSAGSGIPIGEVVEALCVADIGVAVAKALRAGENVGELFHDSFAKLKAFSLLAGEGECQRQWRAPAPDESALKALHDAIVHLNTAKTPDQTRAARTQVVAASVDLVQLVWRTPAGRRNERLLDDLGAVTLAIWNHDWVDAVWAVSSSQTLGPVLLCKADEGECKRDSKLLLVLSVGADIATAQSSDEVQAALARVAEPVGSWRRKFQETFTFTLQGYVGGKYSREQVVGSTPVGSAIAPVLAVGVEPSLSYSRTGRLALFLQVIDVGNFASIRVADKEDDDAVEVEAAPDLEFAQLFAPGVYLIWTPAKMPFVLGLGFDWVPVLRRTDTGPEAAWHAGGFLAVDIPILELVHE